MRLGWIAIALLAFQVHRLRPPAAPSSVVVIAPTVPRWPCDESCYLIMDRVPGPTDCLGCPAGLQAPPWRR